MRNVMISIKPEYCKLIASGKKTVELRKTRPKLDTPFKCYIYCTKQNQRFSIGKHLYAFSDNLFTINGQIKYGDCFEYDTDEYIQLNGKVIGEFVCDFINEYTAEFTNDNCYEEIRQVWKCKDYTNENDKEFAIIVSNEDEDKNNCFLCNASCLSFEDIKKYIGVNFHEISFYGWHISDLVVYDKPKELSEFYKTGAYSYDEWLYAIYNGHGGARSSYESYLNVFRLKRPPQSWCYIEE